MARLLGLPNVPEEFKNFDLTNLNDLYYLFSNYYGKPEYKEFFDWLTNTGAAGKAFRNWQAIQDATNQAGQNGEWNNALGNLASQGVELTPDMETYITNQIGKENTANDQQFQSGMRDTSLLSAASQLGNLGLSSSNVVQVGGASSGVSSSAAAQSMHSNAISRNQLRQQAMLNRYNNQMQLAKGLISAAGSMASSGIYGAALGAVKHSASAVAAATAHSGLSLLKHHNGAGNGPLLSGKLAEEWSKLPGSY